MIITQQNSRLYDSRNFDIYKNYYAILYDKKKYTIMRDKNDADLYTIYTTHIQQELILEVDNDKDISNNIYNIVYGHFYNDQNYFLFKKTHNGKIIGYKINKCQRSELWHNKLNQLYISNYFSDVNKTAIILNNKANEEIAGETTNKILTYIDYNNETLIFDNSWNSDYTNEEILTITVEQPYIIEYKNKLKLKNI